VAGAFEAGRCPALLPGSAGKLLQALQQPKHAMPVEGSAVALDAEVLGGQVRDLRGAVARSPKGRGGFSGTGGSAAVSFGCAPSARRGCSGSSGWGGVRVGATGAPPLGPATLSVPQHRRPIVHAQAG